MNNYFSSYFVPSDYANKIVLPWRYVLSFQCFGVKEVLKENLSEVHIGKKQMYLA